MYTIISLSRRTKEGERFSKQERNRWFRRIGKSTLIPFPFFLSFSFSRKNARKQFWRNFRGWIIHGQLVDAWTFSCKLFNNLENRSILSTFFHFWTNGVENLDAKLPTSVSLFFPFFPFLLHSIPVIRIIKFDRERVAQIRWNYFFADRVLIRLLVPAERIFMNVVECSEQFMRVTCSWRDWNLYCVENFNHIEDRSTLLFDVLYCESCNFISCYEDARSLFTILRIIMTNLSIIFWIVESWKEVWFEI